MKNGNKQPEVGKSTSGCLFEQGLKLQMDEFVKIMNTIFIEKQYNTCIHSLYNSTRCTP